MISDQRNTHLAQAADNAGVSAEVHHDEIIPETTLERRIVSDHRWIAGASWGMPRPGHPEGEVRLHILEVLAGLDRQALDQNARAKLRLVALVHDTFKSEVDRRLPRSGQNHHAMIARRFTEAFTDDLDVLEITELHDEAYNSWVLGSRHRDWTKAQARAARLIERLGSRLPLYLAFYRADNAAGDKRAEPLAWFERLASRQPTVDDLDRRRR